MTESPPVESLPPKPRRWLRRLGKGLLWTLLALVIFHRPIIHQAGRWYVQWLGKKENMAVSFRVSGNVWTQLEIRDLLVMENGKGPAPISRLEIDYVKGNYDLWKLLRNDWSNAVQYLEFGNVSGRFIPQPRNPNKPHKAFLDAFQEALKRITMPAERFIVQNAEVELVNVFKVQGLHINAAPNQPGTLAWTSLELKAGPTFGEVNAQFHSKDRVLSLASLRLSEDINVVSITSTHKSAQLPNGGVELVAEITGGTLHFRMAPAADRTRVEVSVDAKGIRLDNLSRELGRPFGFPALLEHLEVKLAGLPDVPETWSGVVDGRITTPAHDEFPPMISKVRVNVSRGAFLLDALDLGTPMGTVEANGAIHFTGAKTDLAAAKGSFTYKIDVPDLQQLPDPDPDKPLKGHVTLDGVLELKDAVFSTEAAVKGTNVGYENYIAAKMQGKLTARREAVGFEDFFRSLTATYPVEFSEITAGPSRADTVTCNASLNGHVLHLREIQVRRGVNAMAAAMEILIGNKLPPDQPQTRLTAEFNAPQFEQLGFVVQEKAIGGAVQGSADLVFFENRPAGVVHAKGANLTIGESLIGNVEISTRAEPDGTVVPTVHLNLAENSGAISGTGKLSLNAPRAYETDVTARITNLRVLEPLVSKSGTLKIFNGAANLQWKGNGDLSTHQHNGSFNFETTGLQYGALTISEARVSAAYTPEGFQTTELRVVADQAELTGQLGWSAQRLTARDLHIRLAGQNVLNGDFDLPLVFKRGADVLPPEQPVHATVTATNLDLPRLFNSFGETPPVSGTLNLELQAEGTVADPKANLTANIASLGSAGLKDVSPATLELKATLADQNIYANAVLRQRDIQPLVASAYFPFPTNELVKDPALFRNLPVQAEAKLPASSLNFLPKFIPSIARIDGTVAADMGLEGTIAKPRVYGGFDLKIRVMRMVSEFAPQLAGLGARVDFEGDSLKIRRFSGEVGGGRFELSGGVKLAPLNQPTLDLRLKSQKVLVKRDESITIRADADLKAEGPYSAGLLSGTVYITQSRFLKEIDILPLSLPDEPKPRIRSVPTPVKISFPNPPLRDWRFDVAIRTRNEDPLLIRGNVARGAIASNLHFRGTGLEPYLEGNLEVQNFRGTLPLSTLEVTRGYISFSPDAPFVPVLDVQAETRIQNYHVTVNLSGNAREPRMDLYSEPPLSQQDILSLLTTGTVAGEIGSNADALAARAGVMVLQSWYRKLFKKKPGETLKQNDPFLRRFQVDVGGVDAKTGRPEMSGSLQINDRFSFVIDVDLEGHISGRIKYLLRFR